MPETSPVILLYGTDEFAITSAIEKLVAALGDPSSTAMNLTRFDGRAGVDFAALNTAVNAVPFLSARRLVVLSSPSFAFSTPEGHKKLIALLEGVPSTTSLVLVESDLLRGDHWLVKAAQKAKAEIRPYLMPRRRDMPGWIVQEAKKQGGQIDPPAAARLADMTGEDTRIAAQEIAKLLTYVNRAKPVSEKDVEQVSVASAQSSVFDLVDALGMGDGKKAQNVFHRLLDEDDPFELWGMIIRQFRLILEAREIIDEGGGLPQVQQGLSLHEFVAEKIYRQAQHFSMPVLEAIYHKLLEIDGGAKTSRVPLDLAIDTFIVELTQKTN